MTTELNETKVVHYPDGGIGVIPGMDNPIEKIRGKEFFRLREGGYATAPNENGIRMRFPLPGGENTAILITEQVNSNGSLKEISRTEYR